MGSDPEHNIFFSELGVRGKPRLSIDGDEEVHFVSGAVPHVPEIDVAAFAIPQHVAEPQQMKRQHVLEPRRRVAGDRGGVLEKSRRPIRARVVLAARDADRIGPSPLWDGVQTAVEALELEWRRRAIVMVTDGRATGNVHGMAYVMGHAIAASVSINIVAVPTGMFLPQGGTAAARVRPSAWLEEMAGATGGAYAEIGSVGDVAPYLVRSISRLHQVYVLGFPPVVSGGCRTGSPYASSGRA